jgi:hypothetical protein
VADLAGAGRASRAGLGAACSGALCGAWRPQPLSTHRSDRRRPDRGDLPAARRAACVSRDTEDADAEALARAACESALENGNDAIFGALFWFLIGGAPAVIVFRLANTLDAMWGYRTPRWLMFGWAAARIDDVLNFVPARLTALSYASLGATAQALRCWRTQARAWSSPNAGPVMAAGAGAVGVALGGGARYHGEWEERPPLGAGDAPAAIHIRACLRLVQRAVWLWLGLAMLSVPLVVPRRTAGAHAMTHAPIRHGGNLLAAAHRYGRPAEAWLDLSTGINPDGYPVPPLPADAWQRLPQDDDGLAGIAARPMAPRTLPVAGSQAAIRTLPRCCARDASASPRSATANTRRPSHRRGTPSLRWTRPTSSVPIWPMRSITSSSSIRTTRRPGCCPSTPCGTGMSDWHRAAAR